MITESRKGPAMIRVQRVLRSTKFYPGKTLAFLSGIATASIVATGTLVPLATHGDAQTVSTVQANRKASYDGKERLSVENGAIRPFRISIPEEQLVDLRRRIAAAKWPDRELVNDA